MVLGEETVAASFGVVSRGGVRLLVFLPWWERGVVHGMTMSDLTFRGEAAHQSARMLCEAFSMAHMILPDQEHGPEFVDLRGEGGCGDDNAQEHGEAGLRLRGVRRPCDALLTPARGGDVEVARRVAYGVRSADCVPVVVRGASGWGVIHAGWRGLACGVIGRAVAELGDIAEAAVFAAAGGDVYEVGGEVIAAIGATAVARPAGTGKFLLDTAATAVAQVRASSPGSSVSAAGLCTISDERFHSHRRDGAASGRCVTFIMP